MSLLLRMYPGDAWGFLVANVLVQVTAVILAAWVLAHFGSRWNAAWRHGIYLVALVCVLASPALSLVMQETGIALVKLRPPAPTATPLPLPVSSFSETEPMETRAVSQFAASDVPLAAKSHGQNAQPKTTPALSFPDILRAIAGGALVIWLLGMALLLARWCYALHVIAVLRRTAQPLNGEAMAELLDHVRRTLGTDELPPLATSVALDQPAMVGLIRPLVILPEDLLGTLRAPELADILVHECAHAVCRHHVVGLLQRLAGIVFWPHPLMHMLNRELARAREEVCDNYVLRHGNAPRYARTLLELSQSFAGVYPNPAALGLFHCRWRLEDRVADLLDRRRKIMIRVNRWTTTALTASFLLLALLIACTRVIYADPAAEEKAAIPASSPPSNVNGTGAVNNTYANAAKDRGGSVAPKGSDPSGKTSPKDPEGDKKPPKALAYTGQVTDKLTGKPIVGASVTVLRRVSSRTIRYPEWRKLGETKHQTDADGRYTFTIPPEQADDSHLYIEITATHPGYVRYDGGYSFDMFRQNEKLGERPFFENLAMEPAEKVSGTVETPDGKPAKGVIVKGFSSPARNDPSGSWEDTTTNEEGFFQLNLGKRGEAVFWILPNDYAPSTHVLHAKRGDLGHFVLEKGMVLRGRVVDADGKPLKNVWVNAEIRGGPAKQTIDIPVYDFLARSALSDDKGAFTMAPLPAGDYSLIMADKPRGGSGDVHPLPAVFINQEITLDQDRSAKPIEVRATAHVLIAGQYFDSSGKPTSGFAPRLSAYVPGSRTCFWDTAQIDEHGKFTVKSPKGLVATLQIIDNEHHSIKMRASKHGPLNNGDTVDLGVLDRDVNDVAIIRYVAPILLVKAAEEDGTPISKFRPSIRYQFNPIRDSSRLGYVAFERQDDGRWRTSSLLPDEQFTITVDAEGYESKSENLRLPEGAVKELDVRLKKSSQPRASTN